MNERNRKYYKHAYDKIYASGDLEERILNRKEENPAENRRKSYHKMCRAAVAAVVLTVVVPSGVYAAAHHWGVGNFFAHINHTLTNEARDLIERDVAVQTKDKEGSREMPVDIKVKETLCDSGSVNIVLEVKAKEKGKYLLVSESSEENDCISSYGIKTEKTIREYSKSKDLELLYVDFDFDDGSDFSRSAYRTDYALVNDDTLDICLSVEENVEENRSKNLNVALKCSVRRASDMTSRFYSTLNFKLQDKSSSKKASYTSDEKMVVKGTEAVVTKVTMERTEVNTYVKVYYNNPNGEDPEDGLFFRIKDESGTPWEEVAGAGGINLGGGKYCCSLTCNSTEFPDKCVLEAFDCLETNVVFDRFTISKK